MDKMQQTGLVPITPELHKLVGGEAVELDGAAAFDGNKLWYLHGDDVATVPAISDPDVYGVAR